MYTKKKLSNSKGFTLIELLLVVGIIGVLLAVIIPKAIRANINSKYGIVEKNAAELKSFAVQWAEKSIRAQDEQNSVSTLADYYASLANNTDGALALSDDGTQNWIANTNANNWNTGIPTAEADPIPVTGRTQIDGNTLAGPPVPPEDVVESIIPPEKAIKNPFNGTSVFRSPNFPTADNPVTGALALGYMREPTTQGAYYYFAFAYQGTDNSAVDFEDDLNTFHAGSGLSTIPALRNGELFARIR